jgi:pimeloyl-ACP methyl ester carboxylesterase
VLEANLVRVAPQLLLKMQRRVTRPLRVILVRDPVEAGKATAAAIPGASLVLIEGMGHDMPPGAWPRIVDAISDLTAKH